MFQSNEECLQSEQCLLFKSNMTWKNDKGGGFCSNFWPNVSDSVRDKASASYGVDISEGGFVDNDVFYISSEQYFMKCKYDIIDPDYISVIMCQTSSLDVKKKAGKGEYVKWKVDMMKEKEKKERPTKKKIEENYDYKNKVVWRNANYKAMEQAIALKFSEQNESLRNALIKTGDLYLAEQSGRTSGVWDVKGGNWLGLILMKHRKYLNEQNI